MGNEEEGAEMEYALQIRYSAGWVVVGLGPCSLETAQEDQRAWERDRPEAEYRLVQRPVANWILLASPVSRVTK